MTTSVIYQGRVIVADLSRITPEERKALQEIMRPRIQMVVAAMNAEPRASTTEAKCKVKVTP